MPRTCIKVPFSANLEAVNNVVIDMLRREGFNAKEINGETCWKKGTGLATAMQYVKVEYAENELLLYGWIQAGVGDLAGSEMALIGVVGAIPKKKLRKRLDKIAQTVSSMR